MLRKVQPDASGATETAGTACMSDLSRGVISFLKNQLRYILSLAGRISDIDRSILELSTTDTATTNLCGASATAIPWDIVEHGNAIYYKHSPALSSKTKVYILVAGRYMVNAMISYTRQGTAYVKPLLKIRVNGSIVAAYSYGGPLVAGTNGDKATGHLTYVVNLSAGDYIEITSEAAQTQQATYNQASGASKLIMRKVA